VVEVFVARITKEYKKILELLDEMVVEIKREE